MCEEGLSPFVFNEIEFTDSSFCITAAAPIPDLC